MNNKILMLIMGLSALIIVGLIGLTVVLTPQNLEEAYHVAVKFANAAGTGDDDKAYALLTPQMQVYVDQNCPEGSVSACVLSYTPSEWGQLVRDGAAVYRRSLRDGDAYKVQIVATYEEGVGFAGVCSLYHVIELTPDNWRVAGWAGFISCGESNAGIEALSETDAPNRVAP